MGRPITTTYPTEAVRERHTVFVGNTRAEELFIPNSLVCCKVSWIIWPWLAVASRMPIQGILPSQYSGCCLLGVCPVSSRVTSVSLSHFHPFGAGSSGIPTARAYSPAICPVVAARPPVWVLHLLFSIAEFLQIEFQEPNRRLDFGEITASILPRVLGIKPSEITNKSIEE